MMRMHCSRLLRLTKPVSSEGQGIRPRVLATQGLGPALLALRRTSPMCIEVDVQVGRLPAVVESAVYFMCCEALANSAKHAQATSVVVTISDSSGHVVATVQDDGVGGADPAAGSGLRGIADRLEAVGAVLTVNSEAGHGTTVRADLRVEPDIEGPAAAVRDPRQVLVG